ncbi:ATP-binding cassette domain-containing protein [Paenibacillus sp. YYML68]|uniref:ATP-binding cassette domain-containing protein n=1 Tax=Paenibacillus sp. YYML68 TaxID=2909250 RepID=UPI002490A0AE|nr:ATP-binding cassette domain-containing protein [Paenibacillus sp. YYML68]
MYVIKAVERQCRPYLPMLVLLVLVIAIEIAYTSLSPLSFKYLIDDAFLPENVDMFVLVLAVLIIGGLIYLGAGLAGDYILSRMSESVLHDLRNKLLAHLTRQSLDFYARFEQGALLTRLTSDVAAVDRTLTGALPRALKELLGLSIGLCLLLQLEWKLALAMLGGFVVLFLSPGLLRTKAAASSEHYRAVQDSYMSGIDELLKGHRVTKGLHLHRYVMDRMSRHLRAMLESGFRITYTYALMDRIPLTAFLLLNAGVIGLGGYFIMQDDLTVGAFIAFYTIFLSVGQSVSALSQVIPSLIQAEVSFRRIDEVLDYRSRLVTPAQPLPLQSIREGIRFEAVSFGYDPQHRERLALRRITLELPTGGMTAFVGPSGSGKSTALQLLLRFYDPDEGSITVDGNDLRQLDEEQFRTLTGVVLQDSFLFHATIRDNIRLDRTEATEQEVIEAAKAAQVHEFVMQLPQGYDTVVKDYGANLSGGQRQRIAIARVLIRKPQLLVLDEITSALDPVAEAEIHALIESLKGASTIVTVTHRLASVKHADQIVVFREGQAVEAGTHAELLELGGTYRQMWEKQHGFHLSSDGFSATVEVERLSQLPFFHGIPHAHLASISALFVTERYEAGQFVFHEQASGDKLYIIVRGRVGVMKGTDRVAVLEDGDHFGEIALLRHIPRTAGIVTLSQTILLSLRREQLTELTATYPIIGVTLEKSLKERMK